MLFSPEHDALRNTVARFVEDEINPHVDAWEEAEEFPSHMLFKKLGDLGLLGIKYDPAHGGLGLDFSFSMVMAEELGLVACGGVPMAIGVQTDMATPALNRFATDDLKKAWLAPTIAGDMVASIAVSEPHAGSDVANIKTNAKKDGDDYVVHGHKWFITGAGEAQHFILIARTSDDTRKGLTAFLFDADQPGWEILRRIPIMGPEEHGGHCEIEFDGLEIPDENRLMEIGDGLKVTQIRLGTARLTHCMRWTGMAKRALEETFDYVRERQAFGETLADHEGVQWLLGEAAMQIEIGRLLTMRAAAKLDAGDFARKEVSMAKVVVSETLHKAIDTAIQLRGARGYSKDTPLEWMYRYARQARLVDGSSETHKMVLSRYLLNEGLDFWSWD